MQWLKFAIGGCCLIANQWIKPSTATSDPDRISPYNTETISTG